MATRFNGLLLRCMVAVMLGGLLVGCAPLPEPTVGAPQSSPTAATPEASILTAPAQTVSYDEMKQAIDDLYTRHPDLSAFTVSSVSYTPDAREKVLTICKEGSIAADDEERDRQKVLACAPLIFFFYEFGRQNAAPDALTVSHKRSSGMRWTASRRACRKH